MYNIDQLNGKVIWLFRHRRSGSTWFNETLKKVIKRQGLLIKPVTKKENYLSDYSIDFNNRSEEPKDKEIILSTHHFVILEEMHRWTNPILICVNRKDNTENFISDFIFKKVTGIANLQNTSELILFPNIEPLCIPIRFAEMYVEEKKYNEKLWNEHSNKYESEMVYYEDLLTGWDSKLLNIHLSMKNNTKSDIPKLPYDKKKIVINYDEIDRFLKDAFSQ